MLADEQWPVARLIPISSASGVEAQERRAASALLAVIAAVPEFGHALLKPLGAPKGKIKSFIEIPFKVNGRSIRPDGIIAVTGRGGKTWSVVVETKVGAASVEPDQIDTYLDLAKELNFNGVLSISNQFVTSSSEYPVEVNKRKLRKLSLRHWSWVNVLTEAVVQKEHRGVSDPDQAFVLNELIRYMSDPRSGVVSFAGMGPAWTKVRDAARDQTLRKNDPEVATIAARWDDLIRYLGLELTKVLGRDVKQVLPRDEKTPAARQGALKNSLGAVGRLYAELQIPHASGPLEVVADLRARQVVVATRLDAPREGRSKGRVSWLLRQLQDAPESLKVEAGLGRATSLAEPLSVVRDRPEVLYPDTGKEIRRFTLTLTRNMGMKRDSTKGSFAESVVSTVEDFYSDVLQKLRPWKASPPKLKKTAEEPSVPEETVVDMPSRAAEQAIENAEAEMEAMGDEDGGSTSLS